MKKLLSMTMFCAFALAACGGSKPAPATTPPPPAEPPKAEGTPCEQEIALQCPDDQIDGCLKTPREGDVHACVAK